MSATRVGLRETVQCSRPFYGVMADCRNLAGCHHRQYNPPGAWACGRGGGGEEVFKRNDGEAAVHLPVLVVERNGYYLSGRFTFLRS